MDESQSEDDMSDKLKPNIGVYTDPAHKLYVSHALPRIEDIESGEALKEGEVVIEMKATGICGYVANSISISLFTSAALA